MKNSKNDAVDTVLEIAEILHPGIDLVIKKSSFEESIKPLILAARRAVIVKNKDIHFAFNDSGIPIDLAVEITEALSVFWDNKERIVACIQAATLISKHKDIEYELLTGKVEKYEKRDKCLVKRVKQAIELLTEEHAEGFEEEFKQADSFLAKNEAVAKQVMELILSLGRERLDLILEVLHAMQWVEGPDIVIDIPVSIIRQRR